MKFKFNQTLLCKQAPEYSLYGIKKPPLLPSAAEAPSLFQAANTPSLFQTSDADRAENKLFVSQEFLVPSSHGFEIRSVPAPNSLRVNSDSSIIVDVNGKQPLQSDCNLSRVVTTGITSLYAVDLLLENFIASVITIYDQNPKPEIAKVWLGPILVNTICMTYAQCRLLIRGFINARAGQLGNEAIYSETLIKHQLQAITGLLSAVADGVRWYFNIMVVFNQPALLIKNIIAGMAGGARFGAFFMTSGHASCDIPIENTLVGRLMYGVLTSPVTPNPVKLISTLSPIILGAALFSTVMTTKNELEVNNPALTTIFYSMAFLNGMLAFLFQKHYTCGVMNKNIAKNITSIKEWNKFWYGDTNSSNLAQNVSYAIKRFIDILTVLPLAALDMSEKLFSICCYFTLAILPIQLVAMNYYLANPALTYWVFYQAFHNTQGLIEMYSGKETSELKPEIQHLAAMCSLPLGLASTFTLLNVCSGRVLEEIDKVFKNNDISANMTDTFDSPLLPHEDIVQYNLYKRLSAVLAFSQESLKTAFENITDQIMGKQWFKSE